MVTPLSIAIELSDLFEATGYEGTEIAEMFDKEILPMLKTPLSETDVVGMGDRFSKAIDRVRASLNQQGGDRIRTLMDMMKSAILTYIQRTHDVRTGREVFNRAVRSGGDTMLTVTGATILANALAGNHSEQAQTLLRGVAAKLSGAQPVAENASGAAVSTGAIATVTGPLGAKKRKAQMIRRQNSIFAEDNKPLVCSLSWNDLEGQPDTIQKLNEIIESMKNAVVEGVLIDPSTAELVLAVHDSLSGRKQRRYAGKPVSEMIEIAHRAVQRGIISVVME